MREPESDTAAQVREGHLVPDARALGDTRPRAAGQPGADRGVGHARVVDLRDAAAPDVQALHRRVVEVPAAAGHAHAALTGGRMDAGHVNAVVRLRVRREADGRVAVEAADAPA